MTMHVPYMPPLLARPVQRGPMCISIPGVSNVAVLAASNGPAVKYRWPKRLVLRAWILMPQSGLAADAGALSPSIVDKQGEIVFDGLGNDPHANFVPTLPGMGIAEQPFHLVGWTWSPRWNKFARLVDPGEEWIFQVANASAGSITPRLLFGVEAPIL
jgi:hypothetical protein